MSHSFIQPLIKHSSSSNNQSIQQVIPSRPPPDGLQPDLLLLGVEVGVGAVAHKGQQAVTLKVE